MEIQKKLDALEKLIGNTPMVRISFRYKGELHNIYAKLEYYNYSGSIKDRMAYYILKRAYMDGNILPGDEICEATSGNTGIAFTAIGSFLGHKVNIYMPDWMSVERIRLITSLGGNGVLVSKEEGGFQGSIARCIAAGECKCTFLPKQFENDGNRMAHYTTTGPEIQRQMAAFGVVPDGFSAGYGTGGTLMGIGEYLKDQLGCRAFPMEPANSLISASGEKKSGGHRIQGISDDFIPPILNMKKIDDIVVIEDGDAIIMAQMLAKKLGLGVGISSGGNFLAALKIQLDHGVKHAVTTFADDSKKYLSTDYAKEEPVKAGYLSNDIELLSFDSMR
ncbi:MAG: PLP-dependent cysteine synthase family protein [Fusobacteriaceae bacterium]|nr:PLP-dependent cysteine synthase family protein [Fusobacteriaceae bacterium]